MNSQHRTHGKNKSKLSNQMSIDQSEKQSLQSSTRKLDKGPVIKSGALPNEFMLPSPARSIPSRKSKRERDVLDDFIGVKVENPTAGQAYDQRPSKFGA